MPRTKDRLKDLKALGYGSWLEMRARCLSPKNKNYHHYGGRGITIHPNWSTFAGFLSDMGVRPPGMSIERNDVNGNYEPGNCRWIPCNEQSKNTRRIIWFVVDGERLCMKDACKKLGISYTMVRLRIWQLGWDPERAISEPHRGSGRKPKPFLSKRW
jgi:hypothetical protein